MLKSLYGKFIKASMIAVTVLIAVVVIIVNMINILATERAAEKAMKEGRLPEPIIPYGAFVRRTPFSDYSPKKPKYYTAIVDAEGNVYGYLDTAEQRNNEFRTALITLGMGTTLWIAMLFFVIFLSKSSITPIVKNIEEQKRFITDAGHEIKTPLAAIIANLDALELNEGGNKWTGHIRNQTRRLNELMQNLLEFARMGEIDATRAIEKFRTDEILSRMLEENEERFGLCSLTIQSNIENKVYLKWYEETFEKLCDIFLDNMAKYALAGTEVKVSLWKQGRDVMLLFSNKCAALPECAPPELFARFYRGDSARTHKGTGSFGIGLAMAKAIVESQGGSISAEYGDENTLTFMIQLKNR